MNRGSIPLIPANQVPKGVEVRALPREPKERDELKMYVRLSEKDYKLFTTSYMLCEDKQAICPPDHMTVSIIVSGSELLGLTSS